MADAPGKVPNQLRLPCARLTWLFILLIGADRAAALGRGYMATRATVMQRLHTLLGLVVVSGVQRDFVPRRLRSVLVLGKVEQRMRRAEIERAVVVRS